ncbi:MAG TPA: PQQ-dependent dehydrogenase, methanol/ethanol family [Sphingomonadaceae bacterium]|nr:PQQ-dependent dehydrogenase, methanol/ethanol family [Sphingomonadaceae bacterium]
MSEARIADGCTMPDRSPASRLIRPVVTGLFVIAAAVGVSLASAQPAHAPAAVDAARLARAAKEPGQWLADGRTYSAQRFSPLTQIDAGNVKQLGLAWYDDLDTYRGVEATPLYADGVLYNISAWNITTAYDAKTGKRLWTYDPQVPREWGRYACCEPVSRGLALWNGKVIIATLDGRLIGLDARDGKPVWTTQTTPKDMPYSITGAPRVFGGKVVVGNSGGDFGIRGFVSAYDADTGRKLWKFFLTPGNPANGPDHEASDPVMAMAAKTWSGEWWKLGGGANPWDSIAYDPKLNLVYVGTGNGSPNSYAYRSEGKGDNLFICSIVALHADTGAYAWHYQMVPGEDWDYTCTSSIVLADLKIDGRERQVLMQAPKNGFFYVLDRRTGAFISAKNYIPVSWATGIDPKTGRPNVDPKAHYSATEPALVYPGPGGGHNWFPMAFSPKTGLAYLPTYESGFVYALDPNFTPKPFRSNSGWGGYSGEMLKKRAALQKEADAREKAFLTAWDPVKQKAAWKVPLPRHGNGGVLVTASDLVIEGTTRQTFAIFDAHDGTLLWEMPVQSAPVAGPITYMLDGVQYIAVNAGWGGGAAQVERGAGTDRPRAAARLLVFKLGGTATLPPMKEAARIPEPPPLRASEAQVRHGAELFTQTCAVCHGQRAIGGVKDLRHMTRETHAEFNDIVLGGKRQQLGMASFADILSPKDADDIHAYLIARANEDWGGTGK